MKNFSVYFFLTSLMLSTVIVLSACSKNSDDDDDLIGNWTGETITNLKGEPRSEAVSFIIGDNVYVGTGVSGGAQTGADRYSDFYMYNTTSRNWTEKQAFPDERSGAVAFAINGMGYVGTGTHGTDVLKDFYRYDPVNNVWSVKWDGTNGVKDLEGSARRDGVAFVVGNRAFVSTGATSAGQSTSVLSDLWEYHPDTNDWEELPSPFGKKREKAMVFVIENKAYLISGSNNGTALNDIQSFDPATNSWNSDLAKINNSNKDGDGNDVDWDDEYTIPRYNGVAFTMNGKGYVTCGSNGGNLVTTWEYDAATDRWTEKTKFEGSLGREGAVAFVISGRGFVLTGRNGESSFDDGYEWHPSDEQEDND